MKNATLEENLAILGFFEQVEDPRVERTRLHPLPNILVIALLAMICVGEGWEDMEAFGHAKKEWLATFLDLGNGIPSADTFRRVLSAIDPVQFNACFIAWVQALSEGTQGKLVAIDGKTIRHSFDRATGKKALHLVSAWIVENRLTLGQVATEEKSNEITAIPRLLDLVTIRGATVTMDAMGCQKTIAAKIIDNGANYVMGLKGNQGTAHQEIKLFFDDALAHDFAGIDYTFDETIDGSEHGRTEVRRVWETQQLEWFVDRKKWSGLSSIILVESERTIGEQTSIERRYYWSSHTLDAKALGKMIRGHWGIENELHWCLDVAFREDESSMHTDHGPENLALLRKIVLNLVKNERTCKRGMQAKRKRAAWDPAYLLTLLASGLPESQRN